MAHKIKPRIVKGIESPSHLAEEILINYKKLTKHPGIDYHIAIIAYLKSYGVDFYVKYNSYNQTLQISTEKYRFKSCKLENRWDYIHFSTQQYYNVCHQDCKLNELYHAYLSKQREHNIDYESGKSEEVDYTPFLEKLYYAHFSTPPNHNLGCESRKIIPYFKIYPIIPKIDEYLLFVQTQSVKEDLSKEHRYELNKACQRIRDENNNPAPSKMIKECIVALSLWTPPRAQHIKLFPDDNEYIDKDLPFDKTESISITMELHEPVPLSSFNKL